MDNNTSAHGLLRRMTGNVLIPALTGSFEDDGSGTIALGRAAKVTGERVKLLGVGVGQSIPEVVDDGSEEFADALRNWIAEGDYDVMKRWEARHG